MKKKLYSLVFAAICCAAAGVATKFDVLNKDNSSVTETTNDSGQSGTENDITSSDDSSSDESTSSSKKAVAYEIPSPLTDRPEQIVKHTGFTISYNKKHNTPNWSAWKLTRKMTQGTLERGTKFWPDPQIPTSYRVNYYEYKESGFDRGHMCPAGDMKWSEDAMHDCFYMSNMCPQVPQLNSGSWKKLEESCRDWAVKEGSIYIICGPIYKKGVKHSTIGIDHSIDVPDSFFKCVLSLRKGHEKAIGFIYSNTAQKQSIKNTAMSVDEVEKKTGIDFFPQLEDKLEAKLESQYDVEEWN